MKRKNNRKKTILQKTIKYFIQQKFIEIFVLILLIFSPYYLGYYIGDNKSSWCNEYTYEAGESDCTRFEIYMEGMLYLFIAGLIILLLGWITFTNWDKAKERAVKNYEQGRRK